MGRSKYTIRADGRRVGTKTYKDFGTTHYSGRKMFYGKTDAEVDQKIRDFEEEMMRSQEFTGRLFQEIADAWWKGKEPKIALNSAKNYKIAYERCSEHFGDTPVNEIKARDIVNFLLGYQDMSQKVISNTRSVMKQILDVALIDGDIDINPAVALPVVKGKPKVPRKPAPENDIKIIDEYKEESYIGRYYYFILYTGLRRNEAVGVKWKDIDKKNKTVTIARSITYRNSIPEEKVPKTEAGIRTVELLDNVLAILPKAPKNPEKYVFFPEGLPRENHLERLLKEFATKHGLTCTPHQLRHSYASMLHSAGIDVKDAQHLLGHSTVAMTQDIYTHLESEHKKDVQKKLNKYVKDKSKKADKEKS